MKSDHEGDKTFTLSNTVKAFNIKWLKSFFLNIFEVK